MSRTDVHLPIEVARHIDGIERVDPLAFLYGLPTVEDHLPWHELLRYCRANSEARTAIRRKFNRAERYAARNAIRDGDFDALAPRWAAKGQVRWDLT